MEPVRLASIGLGWWGGVLAEKAAAGGADVVRCFARSEDARQAFGETHGARPAGSYEEILADPDVEGVLIATPHSTHADLVVQAAAAGKHIFCDKPFTLTVAEGKRATEAAAAAGVVLQVGHNRRRQPANRRLKQMIDDDELGMIHYAEANLSHPKGLTPRGGWRGEPAESPAGGMTGLGVHMADTLVYLLGRASRVSAFSRQTLAVAKLDDVTTANIEFDNGALAYLATSLVIPDIAKVSVWGTKAAAMNEWDGAQFSVQQSGEKHTTQQEIEILDTVKDELEEFAANLRSGSAPETGGAEATEVIAILEAVVESAARGAIVDLDEVRARS
ncbi:MAG: putative dehydrogenase [Verrucomicrobiales bacterium]|jgi:predicted dehydrogenase